MLPPFSSLCVPPPRSSTPLTPVPENSGCRIGACYSDAELRLSCHQMVSDCTSRDKIILLDARTVRFLGGNRLLSALTSGRCLGVVYTPTLRLANFRRLFLFPELPACLHPRRQPKRLTGMDPPSSPLWRPIGNDEAGSWEQRWLDGNTGHSAAKTLNQDGTTMFHLDDVDDMFGPGAFEPQ